MAGVRPHKMHFVVEPSEINVNDALIYVWSIYSASGTLVGRYVGKAKAGAVRPLKHYSRNVKRLLANMPYRKRKPDAYRKVHRALAEAHAQGQRIVLSYACNVGEGESINRLEAHWIKTHNTKGPECWQLNG